MDGYPAGSLDLNLPYIAVAGLTAEPTAELPIDRSLLKQVIELRSEAPSLTSEDAARWKGLLEAIDARDQPWSPQDDDKPYKFRVSFVGRTLALPPRRALLPEDIETPEFPPVLHSPFSPLSPVSHLYPDGLVDAQWIQKHQVLVPSIYLCFYALTSDSNMATLHDNQLKTDINKMRQELGNSGYRTRLVVMVISDGSATAPSLSEGLQERLDNIRRGLGLDPKSFFYVPKQETNAELEQTADSILQSVYAQATEYYRDLGRHARKKRSRGVVPQPTVPPTTGTSQTLSVQDWNVRYDFKSAVFAEFRHEMDTALRSYDQAYDGILSEDVMDMLPSWSPRWNEARLLTDIIAIRAIRCSLWNGQTTLAVRRWRNHRERISDFVDRRGRGTNNYGWQAWEARWATVMANLIEKANLPAFAPSTMAIFVPPEKPIQGERLQPWELLHHPGYWYRNAARHHMLRRDLAHSIPDQYRRAPEPSAASAGGNKAYIYDTYLCPEPHEEFPLDGDGTNHTKLIVGCLEAARSEYEARKQSRLAGELALDSAKEMVRAESWNDVVTLLRPLWTDASAKAEGWVDVESELTWLLRAAAANAGMGDLVVSVDWGLLHNRLSRRPKWHYDLQKSLDGITVESRPKVALLDENTSSFVSAAFVFRSEQGKAGETCQGQLAITSAAFPDTPPVVLKGLRLHFEGSLKTISLEHADEVSDTLIEKGTVGLRAVPLTETFETSSDPESDDSEPRSVLQGQSHLALRPGHTVVYELAIPLREPGQALASSVDLLFETEAYSLTYTITFREANEADIWYGPSLSKRRIPRLSSHAIEVLPKPPKIEVSHVEALSQYYTDEPIELALDIRNGEDADAVAKLELHVFGEKVPGLLALIDGGQEHTADAAPEEARLTNLSLSTLEKSQSTRVKLRLDPSPNPGTFEITARIAYHLVSDPATPIMQVMSFQVTIVNPFEANYDIVPRLHPDPWPSLFDVEGTSDLANREELAAHPRGIAQSWCLVCHYASFALEDLEIVDLEAKALLCQPGARCISASRPEFPPPGLTVTPKSMHEAKFDLVVQKLSLDDRGPASLDMAVVLKWKRPGADAASPANTTTLPVPRAIVLGTEPRVLASVSNVNSATGLLDLDVTIENGSSHFLTFGLSMEPSEEFAFSGAKQTTLHVLPVSRRTVTYRLLPFHRGLYVRPNLVVRDKYFQKVLRIIPTDGMKIDKEGLLVWVPPAP
ncbi:Gryzun, putative trafficking through golgi-domain-containing protein [Plectosphaerella plurivora]|uniref:Gryzun, putative trafficking through golgi-domain-containing protein n=1 Tax=Plectosphaerella plurivora TaxID=936078 RepID=A0A9P8VLU2_9PEZI|nr:Gryzun, putative trafficking through golgi-domain-containing protein [Plectosphaerella plurivora]